MVPMVNDEASNLLTQLLSVAGEIVDTAKTASRNQKSLGGDNYYGKKFHHLVVKLSASETKLRPVVAGMGFEPTEVADYESCIKFLKLPGTPLQTRNQSLKALRVQIESRFKPYLDAISANPIPSTEQVLPLSVVKKTRTYFEKVVMQANGCYEHQWFDACSVMIRRFVETLIVELYEAKGLESAIKDSNGDYL